MKSKNCIKDLIINIRNQDVILDKDIAHLYDIETKRINEAVKNNLEKFPSGYIIELTEVETNNLRTKISTTKISSKTRSLPKAFTEKGLYMLATIIKSKKATETTIGIIETFAKLRQLSRTISKLSTTKDESIKKSLMQKSGEIINELIDADLQTNETETSIELNFAVLKLKHTIKRNK